MVSKIREKRSTGPVVVKKKKIVNAVEEITRANGTLLATVKMLKNVLLINALIVEVVVSIRIQ